MTLWLSRVLALCLSRESPPSVWRLTCYFVDALLVATDRNRPERLSHSLLLDCLAYYLGVTSEYRGKDRPGSLASAILAPLSRHPMTS